MGIEVRYHKVNGVTMPYWVPVFDSVGADGLVGADARILELPYQEVNGVNEPYWAPDTNGDKYDIVSTWDDSDTWDDSITWTD